MDRISGTRRATTAMRHVSRPMPRIERIGRIRRLPDIDLTKPTIRADRTVPGNRFDCLERRPAPAEWLS
jgi:hypothetical protein